MNPENSLSTTGFSGLNCCDFEEIMVMIESFSRCERTRFSNNFSRRGLVTSEEETVSTGFRRPA